MILLPAMLILAINKKERFIYTQYLSKEVILKTLFFISPILIYFIFLYFYSSHQNISKDLKSDFITRFSGLIFNFQSVKHSVETLISMFLILGIPIYFLTNSLNTKNELFQTHKKYTRAFLITAIINSAIVISTTQARETRLFVIPMFFIWPIFVNLFLEDIKALFSLKNYTVIFKNWKSTCFFIFLNIMNFLISFKAFRSTLGNDKDNYFNEYLFMIILTIIIHSLIKRNRRISSIKDLNNLSPPNKPSIDLVSKSQASRFSSRLYCLLSAKLLLCRKTICKHTYFS